MMAFWNKKPAKDTLNPRRIEVEDMLDQNFGCKEIAEQLEIDINEIYRIKQAKQRREFSMKGRATPEGPDKMQQMREELAQVQLQDKIDEAKHNAWIREQERLDIQNEDVEEIAESAADSPDKLLQTLLLNAALKQRQAQPSNTPGTLPQVPSGVSSGQEPTTAPPDTQNSVVALDFSKVEAAVKAGVLSKERFIKESAAMNLTPEKAEKLYEFIKRKL